MYIIFIAVIVILGIIILTILAIKKVQRDSQRELSWDNQTEYYPILNYFLSQWGAKNGGRLRTSICDDSVPLAKVEGTLKDLTFEEGYIKIVLNVPSHNERTFWTPPNGSINGISLDSPQALINKMLKKGCRVTIKIPLPSADAFGHKAIKGTSFIINGFYMNEQVLITTE